MKFHFTLEYRRLRRLIIELGLHPTSVFIILGVLSVFLISYMSIMTDKSPLLIAALGLASVTVTLKKKRTSFYGGIYSKKELVKTQIAESILLVSPFFLILLFSGFFTHAFFLLLVVTLFPLIVASSKRTSTSFQIPPIPTPFKNNPFEFIQGFRVIWPAYLLALIFIFKAVEVANPNLAVVAFLATLIIPGFFYAKPEPISYVTMYSLNPKGFLRHKMKLAMKQLLILSAPLALLTLILFPDKGLLLLVALVFGLLFVICGLLGKYAYYPLEMNPVQSFSLMFCLLIPPAVLIIIPVFYKKSLANLKPLLS